MSTFRLPRYARNDSLLVIKFQLQIASALWVRMKHISLVIVQVIHANCGCPTFSKLNIGFYIHHKKLACTAKNTRIFIRVIQCIILSSTITRCQTVYPRWYVATPFSIALGMRSGLLPSKAGFASFFKISASVNVAFASKSKP